MRIGKNAATKEYHAAQKAVTDALRRLRQLNDEMADANSALKTAQASLSRLTRENQQLTHRR